MRRGSAVSVDDNLAAGQARVAIGAANEDLPVGLTCQTVSAVIHSAGSASRI